MKITSRKFTLILLISLFVSSIIFGQSKFEYGIGIAINHSKMSEDYRTELGPIEGVNKGIRLPAVSTRIGYKFNDRFHLNSGLGFSWIGSLRKDQTARIIATTIEVPMTLEWNPRYNFHIFSGPVYNYIIGIQSESDDLEMDLIETIDSRHQLGLRHGIAYSNKLLELSLSYTHHITDVFNFPLFFEEELLGSYVSKFRNIQLGIVFRR